MRKENHEDEALDFETPSFANGQGSPLFEQKVGRASKSCASLIFLAGENQTFSKDNAEPEIFAKIAILLYHCSVKIKRKNNMPRACALCGKTSRTDTVLVKLRGKFNPTTKKRKYPNLQWVRLLSGKRIKACTQCIKSLHKK